MTFTPLPGRSHSSAFTWYSLKIGRRIAASSSWPMLYQVSV